MELCALSPSEAGEEVRLVLARDEDAIKGAYLATSLGGRDCYHNAESEQNLFQDKPLAVIKVVLEKWKEELRLCATLAVRIGNSCGTYAGGYIIARRPLPRPPLGLAEKPAAHSTDCPPLTGPTNALLSFPLFRHRRRQIWHASAPLDGESAIYKTGRRSEWDSN
jgi:hypothetical protein